MPHKPERPGDADYGQLIGRITRQLRAREGWTQVHAAGVLGLSLSSYKRLELGQYMPSGADLRRMAVVYRVDSNLLLHGVALTGEGDTPAEHASVTLRRGFNRFSVLERQQQAGVVQLVEDLYEIARKRGGPSAEEFEEEVRARLLWVLAQSGRGERG